VQAIVEVQNVVGRLRAQPQAVVEGNGRQGLAGAEMRRATERQGAESRGLKRRVELLEQDDRELSEVKESHPQTQEAPGPSSDFSELVAVVGLHGGSRATGGLSA
jgi:hypothetical protein